MKQLILWSKKNYSHLPWRASRTLYGTLVSEIMLQQTTVGTVLNHFDKFLNAYPNIARLAEATEEEICIAWKGLGYYRRARNLLKAAKHIKEHHNGSIPLDYHTLIEIPGIGDYTASALLSIGANQKALAIDANIERVLARLYFLQEPKGLKLNKKIKELFDNKKILKSFARYSAREINESLMDLGRVYCQANKVDCVLCPISKSCLSKDKEPVLLPTRKNKKTEFFELDLLRVVVKDKNKVLVYQKTEKEWLSGQYELPTFIIKSQDKSLKQYPKLKSQISIKGVKKIKTGITKYKITNYIIELKRAEFDKLIKKGPYELRPNDKKQNFSTTTFKVLSKV